ncbi:hypothetical protein SAMN04488137_1645 [Fictibacillus solisalsi]|uniref:Uncharacterized protein n=1 Tax=Fictibacillus solisalsi TaxID=459525 RepID=A0A1G9VKD7_9BACL|nr:hypothetical protein [Fictibacillus solisalsi]SDM72654.1 hypothetical protein SAMN04488137_1645 [Fictibacillus solisalsi]
MKQARYIFRQTYRRYNEGQVIEGRYIIKRTDEKTVKHKDTILKSQITLQSAYDFADKTLQSLSEKPLSFDYPILEGTLDVTLQEGSLFDNPRFIMFNPSL